MLLKQNLNSSPSPLLVWQGYNFPINWPLHFDLEDPELHLEIGFGDGRYTTYRALEQPKAQFIGLEISNTSIRRAIKRIYTEDVQNVYILKVSAEFALRNLFLPSSLTSITINFPDPWPKKKQQKNRLLQSSFFNLAANRLKTNGEIYLATDHLEYLNFARVEAKATNLYNLKEVQPPNAVFQTKYALKWKEQGRPLYYQVFECQDAPTLNYPILIRDKKMPHAILEGKLPSETPFEKQSFPYVEGHVILHEVSKSWGANEKGKLLLRATINEPDLRQQVLVAVKERKESNILVRLESFGDPIITKTMRGAIHGTTEWLLSLNQGLKVIKRDY